MGRKRNNGLSEEKRNIIGQLIEMYDELAVAWREGRISAREAGGRLGFPTQPFRNDKGRVMDAV